MFGGACTQTPELMPLPVALSRALCNRLTECVHSNDLLRPDGKTQVSVEYDEAGNVVGIDTVVVSIMHSADFEISELRRYIREGVSLTGSSHSSQRGRPRGTNRKCCTVPKAQKPAKISQSIRSPHGNLCGRALLCECFSI